MRCCLGMQKLDGLQGRLVVRIVQQYDENGAMYDYDLPEHVVIIQDWMDDTADNHFPGLTGVDKGQNPKAILLTGIGNTVAKVTFSGERYDIVLEALQQAGGSYWIHVKSLSGCAAEEVYQLGYCSMSPNPGTITQYPLILQDTTAYTSTTQGSYEWDLGSLFGTLISLNLCMSRHPFQLNCVLNPENGTGGVSVASLINPLPVPKYIKTQKADLNILLSYGNHVFDPSTFYNFYERYYVVNGKTLMSHTVNNISFVSPPAPPLSQPADVPAELLCPFGTDGMPTCPSGGSYCECVQVIDIPLGSVVQILLDDKNPGEDISHPFHLHGYAFYVMAEGQYTNGLTVQDVYKNMTSQVLMQSTAPIQKDTLAVPSNGYAIIKFRADNPGYWFYHCHFMYHIATGMGVVFKVGQAADLPPVPTGFPKCGDFRPQVYQ
ncbi:hypothetical protein ANN_19919 [Periplaneta americana]|uniref:Plastocyanin-like domain-containing protein n=1 Tax=Periplaneta americana TaxID=6978 RepID=A0ABQ8SB69_PERAM|nr:hypothetical protein ANN_19919 [Periplaneta americana]